MPSKGTTSQRGYGTEHQALRREYAKLVRSGQAHCWRCGRLIHPNAEWDLGHSDDRARTIGPEHARAGDCPAGGNRSTAGRWKLKPEPHPGLMAPT